MKNLNNVSKREIVNIRFGYTNSEDYISYVAVYAFTSEEAEENHQKYLILNSTNLFELISKIDMALKPRKIHKSTTIIPEHMVKNMAPRPKPLDRESDADLVTILNAYNSTSRRI